MGEDSLVRFQNLLRTLFQFDYADLDFGIYRILNYKRKQIEAFIIERLPKTVEEAFGKYAAAEMKEAEQEVERLRAETKRTFGIEAVGEQGQLKFVFHDTPLGKEYLRALERAKSVEVAEELRSRVYNDLYTFFSRYYEEGDFVSKRRYGRNETYVIPYNGEEVVLHWANRDQYYIKTGENFKTYRFKVGDYTMAFQLGDVSIEQSNQNKNRYFILVDKEPIDWNAGSKALTMFLEYRPLMEAEEKEHGKTEQQRPQDKLNELTEKQILELVVDMDLKVALAKIEKRNGREKSVLRWRLDHFTRRNTTDFFIHKDLRGFLRRELDFFIKNEVLQLDELVGGKETDLQRHVQRGRVVRDIAESIIDFLAQVEDFQKKLFEKKKFVVRTDYCLTIDRVPEEFWDEILANNAQIAEWQELYSLDEPLKSTSSKKAKRDFLKAHLTLVIDTRHFSDDFKWRLLARFDDLEEALDGVLVKSENWQALSLLIEKYREAAKSIYIDPPFNTGTNEFLYKNNYLNSTWLCMLADRVAQGKGLLDQKGNMFVRIDHHGDFYIRQLLSSIFGEERFQNQIIVKRGRETAGTRGKLEIASEKLFWFSRGPDPEFHELQIPRSVADVQWTAFLMGGERHPRERDFFGKTLMPPDEQHFPLSQSKVDQLLADYFLRLRCRDCGAIYFKADGDYMLQKEMKKKANRHKFYDITPDKVIHGVLNMNKCLECGGDNWVVDYLGAPTVNASNLWIDIESYARTTGFFTENSEELLRRVVTLSSSENELVCDYFLGSGTTTAVAHKMRRRWLGVDIGEFFEDIPLTRMKRVLYGDTKGISQYIGWKGGGIFKYHVLEQYEDSLNNVEIPREAEAQQMMELFGDEYFLRYMLDFETQGSPSLLNLDRFKEPFSYKLRIQEGDEIHELTIDLVETFNYLLGVNVKKMMAFEDNGLLYRGVLGEKNGNRIVTIWRPVTGLEDNEQALMRDRSYIKEEILPALLGEAKQDRVLINGISFVEEAEAIEPEFKRLMFGGVA